MVSETADIPDHSSSEDLCSLEVQGSDSSPYGPVPMVATYGSCTSLEHSARSSLRRQARARFDYNESSVAQDSKPQSPQLSPDAVGGLDKEENTSLKSTSRTQHRERTSRKLNLPFPSNTPSSSASNSAVTSTAGATSALTPSACTSPSPTGQLRGTRLCFSVWSPSTSSSVALQPNATSVLSSSSPHERPRTLRATRGYRKLARIVRSTSEPLSCASISRSMWLSLTFNWICVFKTIIAKTH